MDGGVMALEDLLKGLNPNASTYSMMSDPIYGPLFRGMERGKPTRAGGGPMPSMGKPMGSNWEKIAREMAMRRYGYSPEEWRKLDYIIERESGWNPNALNEGSGAYGIPQVLPSAHPGLKAKLGNDPMAQIRWLLNYVEERYGGVANAFRHKQSTGWY
jgi:hypothetical protein